MSISLSAAEVRVLGVLLEKSLAQPQYYPMTLNAITNACNQKSNRDPVLAMTEGEVGAALHLLQHKRLAQQAPPDRGSRSNRFGHSLETRYDWNAAQRAIMAELMLRGPQTVGELRGRASRMTHLESVDYARDLLDELRRTDPPLVVELPREPGRSATRFAHLLSGAPVVPAAAAALSSTPAATTAKAPAAQPSQAADTATPDVQMRLNALECEVIALRLDLDHLLHKLDAARGDHRG